MIARVPYTEKGFLDVGELIPHIQPFTWLWGGRGIGKTFGVLKYVRYNDPHKFLLLRRTQKQVDMLKKEIFNPFRPIDQFTGNLTAVKKDGDLALFYNGSLSDDGTVEAAGAPVGYAAALSTIHNIRGIDMSDVDYVVFDEYIPEKHEKPIAHEYDAFLNAIETISRNRELQGRQPLKMIGLSNANTLGNPYFLGMGVIRQVDRMLRRGTEIWQDPGRCLMLINITGSPVSDQKSSTSLYKLADSGSFRDMSLGNDFTEDHCSRQGSIPLRECVPELAVGELVIYRHKSARIYYCCDHLSGSPKTYGSDDSSLKKFRVFESWIWSAYMQGLIVFQDILCEVLLKKYLNY